MRPVRWLAVLSIALASFCFAGAADEDFRPQIEAPRLLLQARRLRLLKREAERSSPRWQAFAAVATGSRALPEPGFAKALYYRVSGDQAAAAAAIRWAMESPADARQVALVLDWCGPAMTAEQRAKIAAGLAASLSRAPAAGLRAMRDRAFGALAIADAEPALSERVLRELVERSWRGDFAPRLARGDLNGMRAEDELALAELLHAINDNLRIDLREDAPNYFRALPRWHALSHNPHPVASEEGEFFAPIFGGSPVASRAAGFALVAYDTNSQESQFLQGWLMQDRTTMRSAAGAPYEFLWANPYLPGLSYHHMPTWIHDPDSGRLAMRSSWEDDADWLGTVAGGLKNERGGAYAAPDGTERRFGLHLIVFGMPRAAVATGITDIDVAVFVGLDPDGRYQLLNGSDKPSEVVADRNGFVSVTPNAGTASGIRLSRGKAGRR